MTVPLSMTKLFTLFDFHSICRGTKFPSPYLTKFRNVKTKSKVKGRAYVTYSGLSIHALDRGSCLGALFKLIDSDFGVSGVSGLVSKLVLHPITPGDAKKKKEEKLQHTKA